MSSRPTATAGADAQPPTPDPTHRPIARTPRPIPVGTSLDCGGGAPQRPTTTSGRPRRPPAPLSGVRTGCRASWSACFPVGGWGCAGVDCRVRAPRRVCETRDAMQRATDPMHPQNRIESCRYISNFHFNKVSSTQDSSIGILLYMNTRSRYETCRVVSQSAIADRIYHPSDHARAQTQSTKSVSKSLQCIAYVHL